MMNHHSASKIKLSRTPLMDKELTHPAGDTLRATVTWLVLLGLTTLSFKLSTAVSDAARMFTIMGITLVKGHLVSNEFMLLRQAPRMWRMFMAIYLLAVGGVIAFAYLSA